MRARHLQAVPLLRTAADVETEAALGRMGENWRSLLRLAARAEHLNHVVEELVEVVDLLFNLVQARIEGLSLKPGVLEQTCEVDGGSRQTVDEVFGTATGFEGVDSLERIALSLSHVRSLLRSPATVKETTL